MKSRNNTLRSAVTGTLLLVAAVSPAAAKALDAHEQRVLFLESKKALERSDYEVFSRNIPQLKDYPLYPYLVYWQLLDKLDEQPAATIEAFLINYRHLPIAAQLRGAWLRRLAREERWEEFLQFYQGGGTTMQCRLHLAQLNTGMKKEAWDGAKELWLVGHSQPDECDGLFAAWEQSGGMNRDLRWERIELAMDRGNTGLAKHIAEGLDETDQAQVTLWRRAYNEPTLVERSEQLKPDSQENRRIIIHSLKRLARKDAEQTARIWHAISGKYRFTDAQNNTINRVVALNYALDGDPRALIWFAQLPASAIGQTERAWAARIALRLGNWKAAQAWIEAMPVTERQSVRWQYWLARIKAQLGKPQEAEHLYFTASSDRGYYGFLAADQIESDYNLDHRPVEVTQKELQALKETPEMVRAHELFMLLLTKEARLEWEYAVAKLNNHQRLVAGKLANEWRWYDTALYTLAKASYFSDLDIRFPLAHTETVTREAKSHELDPSWVYAVARQESAMAPDARSPAGAMGLMQLMPSTGKAVAKQLNYTMSGPEELLQPDTNIRLGTYYLRQVLDRFNDNPVLATAAYNAGPHRVDKWFPQEGTIDADIWVENMPFHETRLYVRRVMAYSVFYDQRLDKRIKRLNQRMPPIGPDTGQESL